MQVFNFTIPSKYLFNGAAVVVGVTVAAFMVRGLVVSEAAPPCSERYDGGVQFSLQRTTGEPLQAGDLQARVNGSDWGLIENVRIVKTRDADVPVALEVRLPKGAAGARGDGPARSGMGFTWVPAKLKAARTACLGYSVFLPDTFDFVNGGVLPGLVGIGGAAGGAGEKGFALRFGWRGDGGAEVLAQTADFQDGTSYPIDPDRLKLARGRWLKIDQEVLLNTPGERDGILRVWVDGDLRLDRWGMRFREKAATGFTGVGADVHYKPVFAGQPGVKADTAIRVSPLRLYTN